MGVWVTRGVVGVCGRGVVGVCAAATGDVGVCTVGKVARGGAGRHPQPDNPARSNANPMHRYACANDFMSAVSRAAGGAVKRTGVV